MSSGTNSSNAIASSTNEEQTPTKCHFLSIPQEVRDQIYALTVVRDYPLSWGPVPNVLSVHSVRNDEPPLARTNRQIREEALSYYHKHNHFILTIRERHPMPSRIEQVNYVTLRTHSIPTIISLDLSQGLQQCKVSFEPFPIHAVSERIHKERVEARNEKLRRAIEFWMSSHADEGFDSVAKDAFEKFLDYLSEVGYIDAELGG